MVDCLGEFPASVTDPFLLLHSFGPTHISGMPTFGMHPHRGFCEVPYLKKGTWFATDPWNMNGEGEDAKFLEGQLQWGKAGRGIEHGMRKDSTYDGPVQGFQLWVNLKSENKLDPPIFQNARADALPLLTLSPQVKAKLLVGGLADKVSPIDTFGVDVSYIDYMLDSGGEATCLARGQPRLRLCIRLRGQGLARFQRRRRQCGRDRAVRSGGRSHHTRRPEAISV